MTDRPWLAAYPQGVPADIDTTQYSSLVALMDEAFKKYANRVAYSFMGKDVTYAQTDSLSSAFAAYLQGLGLVKGDRVAIMMPNVPQYPVAVAAILRAGLVVVNVNPLYTPRELEHQLKDSGSKAIVIIENFATTLQSCIANTPVKHVVLCAMGDQLGFLKGMLVNYVVRNVKKLVPEYSLPGAVRFNDAIAKGQRGTFKPVDIKPDDIALLQYTGGTTGPSSTASAAAGSSWKSYGVPIGAGLHRKQPVIPTSDCWRPDTVSAASRLTTPRSRHQHRTRGRRPPRSRVPHRWRSPLPRSR